MIICLCGSTRYRMMFEKANEILTLAGHVVLSCGVWRDKTKDGDGLTPDQRARLDDIHLQKIDLADAVLVLDVACYTGESTKREMLYAARKGKPVCMLSEISRRQDDNVNEEGKPLPVTLGYPNGIRFSVEEAAAMMRADVDCFNAVEMA